MLARSHCRICGYQAYYVPHIDVCTRNACGHTDKMSAEDLGIDWLALQKEWKKANDWSPWNDAPRALFRQRKATEDLL